MLPQMAPLYCPSSSSHEQRRINPLFETNELEWVTGQDLDSKCQGRVPVHFPIILWPQDSLLVTQAPCLPSRLQPVADVTFNPVPTSV